MFYNVKEILVAPAVKNQLAQPVQIQLEALAQKAPVIPEEAVPFYKQNCMVCLDNQGHQSGVALHVDKDGEYKEFAIVWLGEVTDQMRQNQYTDLVKATDFAACTIALLLISELSPYQAIEQSIIGTTIDYYLIPREQDETLIFNRAARLEVSGILYESESNTVTRRVREKLKRLKPEGDLPDYVIVVEFSKPRSQVVKT